MWACKVVCRNRGTSETAIVEERHRFWDFFAEILHWLKTIECQSSSWSTSKGILDERWSKQNLPAKYITPWESWLSEWYGLLFHYIVGTWENTAVKETKYFLERPANDLFILQPCVPSKGFLQNKNTQSHQRLEIKHAEWASVLIQVFQNCFVSVRQGPLLNQKCMNFMQLSIHFKCNWQ